MTTTRTSGGADEKIEALIDDTLGNYAVEVVPRLPSSYPRRRGLTCGESNVRALLDAFGVEYIPEPRGRQRLLGLSFPADIRDTLIRHGLDAVVRRADELHDDSRLALLRGHIDSHEPVILAIGNGHLSRMRESPIGRALLGHFITVYGYDAAAGLFFVYDPFLAGDHPEPLPAGNDVRTEQQILRDWRGPIYYPLIGMDHTFIPVGVHSRGC